MTSDGISTQDWDEVHELAVEIVNASALEDEVLGHVQREKLFEALDRLEEKYGRLPSLVGTRGDFAEDGEEAVALWKEAHELARQRGDLKLQAVEAESLAEYYAEHEEAAEAARWSESRKIAERSSAHGEE